MEYLMNRLAVFCCYALILLFSNGFGDNPVIQTCFTADPAPLVYDSTVYIYVGQDSADAPDNGYLMKGWRCYSSKDMVNWTDHGVVFRTRDISWSGGEADAAEVDYRDGKFYYYISTPGPGGTAIGVAVADSPFGPFTDIGQPLIRSDQMTGCNATHSWRGLDPTVLINDDGKAYLFTGNNVLYWVTLNDDMVSWNGTLRCLAQTDAAFAPDYEEAPWIYKRNNIYYIVFASQFPESVRYCTSSSPTGPWTNGGLIMDKQPNGVSNTIHPGVCEFQGNSYLFYHNAGLPNGGSYRRSVCIEQFEYNQDGSIPKIPETKGGVVTGVGHLNPYDTIQAETICWSSGVATEGCSEGGLDVYKINNRDYIKVESVDFDEGADSFDARVAAESGGGSIELRLDAVDGDLIGTCEVAATGGMQKWATNTCAISGVTGVHDLFLVFTGGSGYLFTFNWWKFTPSATNADVRSDRRSIRNTWSVKPLYGGAVRIRTPASEGLPVTLTLLGIDGRTVISSDVVTVAPGVSGTVWQPATLRHYTGVGILRIATGKRSTSCRVVFSR